MIVILMLQFFLVIFFCVDDGFLRFKDLIQ